MPPRTLTPTDVFGPDAALDVKGSFAVTTADVVRLADGGSFNARTPAGSSNPGQSIAWEPSPGEHEVRVIDAAGLSDRVTIRVTRPIQTAAN